MQSRRIDNAKKVTGILCVMFGVIPLTFFYYSIERNIRIKRTLERSCGVVREVRDRDLTRAELVALYGQDDGVRLDDALGKSIAAHCDGLQAELEWWMWNVRREIELDVPEASRERVGELPEQVLARCAQHAPATRCAQKEAVLRGFVPVPSNRQAPWSWASRASAVAREVVKANDGNVGRLSPY